MLTFQATQYGDCQGRKLFFCARMGCVIDLRQVLKIKVSVDLRTANARMTEQLLHRAQVAARLQQMAREAVPQHVWMDVHAEPQRPCPLAEPVGDAADAQTAAAAGDEERGLSRRRKLSPHCEPGAQSAHGPAPHGHAAVAVALSAHRDHGLGKIQSALDVEAGEFGDT